MVGEDLLPLVGDLVGLVDFMGLEDMMDVEDWEGLVCVLVVLQEYQVIDSVDLVDRVCPDPLDDLQVVLLLWVPKEC